MTGESGILLTISKYSRIVTVWQAKPNFVNITFTGMFMKFGFFVS